MDLRESSPVCEEDLSSNIPLEVEKDIAWRLGETGLDDVLVGDPSADLLGGEPGGVMRGVLLSDANTTLWDAPDPEPAHNITSFADACTNICTLFLSHHQTHDHQQCNLTYRKCLIALKKI